MSFHLAATEIVKVLRAEGLTLEIVNGGGSAVWSVIEKRPGNGSDHWVGILYVWRFRDFKEVHYRPAAFFTTTVIQISASGMVTCLGGGYPASGAAGAEKLPAPRYYLSV